MTKSSLEILTDKVNATTATVIADKDYRLVDVDSNSFH